MIRRLGGHAGRERRGRSVALRTIASRRVIGILRLRGPVHHRNAVPGKPGLVTARAVAGDA